MSSLRPDEFGNVEEGEMHGIMLAVQKLQMEAQRGMQRQMPEFQAKAMESLTRGSRAQTVH